MIAFGVTALLLLASAVMVVTTRDLVRAVLWLAVTLVFTAIAFIQLRAEMLAAIQIMLYTGGVITLMLFAVLLTWRRNEGKPQIEIIEWARGILAAGSFLALVVSAILRSDMPTGPSLSESNSAIVGELFLRDSVQVQTAGGTTELQGHILAFEALSVILLAAMIGAIAIARRRDAA